MLIRWSAIASRLPRRTDNEIKNYWNTHLKKRLNQVWVEPTLLASPPTGQTHVTQWDLTLAEAEARLKRGCRAPVHPSAFFMRSWKTSTAEPTFGALGKPQNQSFNNSAVSEALSSCTGTSTVSMADDSQGDGLSGSILFQNQISPPTSSSHGGSGGGPVHSPSGSTTSDCLDFILQHQSSQFPVLLDQVDTFWQRNMRLWWKLSTPMESLDLLSKTGRSTTPLFLSTSMLLSLTLSVKVLHIPVL